MSFFLSPKSTAKRVVSPLKFEGKEMLKMAECGVSPFGLLQINWIPAVLTGPGFSLPAICQITKMARAAATKTKADQSRFLRTTVGEGSGKIDSLLFSIDSS